MINNESERDSHATLSVSSQINIQNVLTCEPQPGWFFENFKCDRPSVATARCAVGIGGTKLNVTSRNPEIVTGKQMDKN